ncbi:MAG TPA: hypothetical protein VE031_01170 [Chthoniobacterales bacterium]|nr:hypothetical protein [Chthoniobacterales bacterium]
MKTVREIREAIRKLGPKEAWQLAGERREYLDDLWDKEFEEDVNAGRLNQAIARAREEYAGAKTGSESCGSFHAALGSIDEHAG